MRRITSRVAGSILFAAALLIPAAPFASSPLTADHESAVRPIPAISAWHAQRGPVFRLGNAARPVGWSTAIGDFNADDIPDVAVADRVACQTGRCAYRIEFSTSGQPRNVVTFESEQDSVAITVSDVDHDNDLDVVVASALSGKTLGIWLNDGRGHFMAADVRQYSETTQSAQSLSPEHASDEPSLCGPSPRRTDHGVLVVSRQTRSEIPRRTASVRRNWLPLAHHSSAIAARAPPHHPASVLS